MTAILYKSLDDFIIELNRLSIENMIQYGVTNDINQEIGFYSNKRKFYILYASTPNIKSAGNDIFTKCRLYNIPFVWTDCENSGFAYMIYKNPKYSIFNRFLNCFGA